MSASYYLTVMFDNDVSRQQVGSCSVTSLRVWLTRLVISLVNCFVGCVLFCLCQTQLLHVIFRTSDLPPPCSLWPEGFRVDKLWGWELSWHLVWVSVRSLKSNHQPFEYSTSKLFISLYCSSSCNSSVVAPPSPSSCYLLHVFFTYICIWPNECIIIYITNLY